MFYCGTCAGWRGWPAIIPVTFGACEVCGKRTECYETHSRFLPRAADKAPGGLTWNEQRMHLRAGVAAGEELTCGTKVRHTDFRKAAGHALSLNRHPSRQRPDCDDFKEAYPCPWCGFWHVGRKMTPEERARYGC